MHTIESDKFYRYIPSDLSECSPQQYIDMCSLLFDFHTNKITSECMLNHAVYKLMNMEPVKPSKKSKQADNSDKESNIVLLQELIQSSFFEKVDLNEDGNYNLKVIQNYIDNPVPKIKPLWCTYYGPSNGFENIKCGEYVDALKLFQSFNATGELQLLYELAATLYRPKKRWHYFLKSKPNYDGDCRIPYNQYQLNKRIKTLQYVPIGFIYGVYLYFASFQIFISSAEVPWGDKMLNFSILFNNGGHNVDIAHDDIGLDSVLFAMAETGAFGDINQMNNTPFWTMMIKMYDARIKQLQQEKQQENANSQSPS